MYQQSNNERLIYDKLQSNYWGEKFFFFISVRYHNINCRFGEAIPMRTYKLSLRKQAYSNVLKILPPKNENFQIKIQIFFIFMHKT